MDFQTIYDLAHAAGMAAVNKLKVVPMVVQQHQNVMDDNSPVTKKWYVADGVCGFAWVNVKPGNSAFANWLKVKKLASRDSYYGGVSIWISDFNQSMQKKKHTLEHLLKHYLSTVLKLILIQEWIKFYG